MRPALVYGLTALLLQFAKRTGQIAGCTAPPKMLSFPPGRCTATPEACRMEARRANVCFVQDRVRFTHSFADFLDGWIRRRRRASDFEVITQLHKAASRKDPERFWCLPANRSPKKFAHQQSALLAELESHLEWFDRVHFLQWYRYGDAHEVLSNEGWWALVVIRLYRAVIEAKEKGDPVYYYRFFGQFVPLPGLSDCITAHRSVFNWLQLGFVFHRLGDMVRERLGWSTYCEDLLSAQVSMLKDDYMYVSVQETLHPYHPNVLVLHSSGEGVESVPLPKMLAEFRSMPPRAPSPLPKRYWLSFLGSWNDGGTRVIRHALIPYLEANLPGLFVGKTRDFRNVWSQSDFCLVPRGNRRRAFMETECLALADCICVYIWDDFERLPYAGSAAHWHNLGISERLSTDLAAQLKARLDNVTEEERTGFQKSMRTFRSTHYTFEGMFEQITGLLLGAKSDLSCGPRLTAEEQAQATIKATQALVAIST